MHRACTNNPLKSDRQKLDDMVGKTHKDEFFLCPCKKQLFHLTKSAVIQIAKTVQWIETCWHWSSEEGPDATENRRGGSWVSHVPWQSNVSKRVQVRPGDQPGYPKDTIESFVGHSSMGLLCPPAIIMQNRWNTKNNRQLNKEVLHLCRWSTHTPRCREAFAQVRKR